MRTSFAARARWKRREGGCKEEWVCCCCCMVTVYMCCYIPVHVHIIHDCTTLHSSSSSFWHHLSFV